MSLAPGTQLGPYEILAPLGAGGMGEVYRARDARLKREVAIKLLPAAMAHDVRALQRMEQEARVIAALNHPNLLSIHDIGQTPDGAPYIVTELLDGESLRQRLQSGPLAQSKAVDFATQLARGLAAAHDQGIIHRDLKPENIFLTRDGRLKILDFGLAKLNLAAASDDVTVAAPAAATAPGMVLGTVGYMSPEQVRGQPADARSDIFSLGAVLYEMLAGRRAFHGDSAVEVMSAILKEEPQPLTASTASATHTALSPALDRIVRHCLEKEPRQRFQSADDVAFSLADLTQSGSTTSLAALPAPSRRRLVPALIVALVLAAAAALWFALRPGQALTPPRLLQATYDRGTISGARFLPGGQNFIVSAAWNGALQSSLFTGQTPTPAATQPVPQPLSALHGTVVAVSPSGAIAVLAGSPHYGVPSLLSVIPSSGGAPRPLLRDAFGAAWPPNDASSGSAPAIARWNASSRTTTLEYPIGHVLYHTPGFVTNLRFSPDGKWIAFLDHPIVRDDRGSVAVVDLAGHLRRLTPVFASSSGLAWPPRGGAVWFTAARASVRDALYAVSLQGKLRRVWQAPSSLTLDDIAPDGRVLLSSSTSRFTARLVTLHDALGQDVTMQGYTAYPTLSDDGRELALDDENNATQYATYLSTVGSPTPPVRLGNGVPISISPDSQWVLSGLPDPSNSLDLLPTGPGQPRLLVPAGRLEFLTYAAAFLPNSTAVLAIARAPGHPYRTYLIHLDGTFQAVTADGVRGYWPTPDGHSVLAVSAVALHRDWALYPIAGGAPTPVRGLTAADNPLHFGADANHLYVFQYQGLGYLVFDLNLRTGQRTLLTTLRPPDPAGFSVHGWVTVSRDGKVFAFSYLVDLSTLYVASGLH